MQSCMGNEHFMNTNNVLCYVTLSYVTNSQWRKVPLIISLIDIYEYLYFKKRYVENRFLPG